LSSKKFQKLWAEVKKLGELHKKYKTYWTPTKWHQWVLQTRFASYRDEQHQVVIPHLLQPKENETILEAGCGYGRVTRMIVPYGPKIIGVDISKTMVDFCSESFPVNFRACIADITELPFADSSFDKVICNGTIEHVENPEKAIKELVRVLKPGGIILVSATNSWSLYAPIKILRNVLFKSEIIARHISPLWFKYQFKKQGMEVLKIVADSFAASINIWRITFPPKSWLGIFKKLDNFRNLVPLKYFGYGTFVLSQKPKMENKI
jgi:ubiquinone/menaquinone biosynthesis C-methylase UbiE